MELWGGTHTCGSVGVDLPIPVVGKFVHTRDETVNGTWHDEEVGFQFTESLECLMKCFPCILNVSGQKSLLQMRHNLYALIRGVLGSWLRAGPYQTVNISSTPTRFQSFIYTRVAIGSKWYWHVYECDYRRVWIGDSIFHHLYTHDSWLHYTDYWHTHRLVFSVY
jgi:hypothetical protein